MTPREIVQEQILHRETATVPYSIAFEPDVIDRLNAHYGGPEWRDGLVPYITGCGKVTNIREPDAVPRIKDVFGTVWQTDKLPPAVIEPALKSPSFDGYTFPTCDMLLDRTAIADTRNCVADTPGSFTIINIGLCLWQSWYLRGFETTMMDCALEEDFYAEMLDRLTDLTIEVIEACKDIPADAIMIGDDWGNQRGVMIGPDRWRRFYKSRYARIFQAVHRQSKVAILHCCGSVADIMQDIIEIDLDVLESVQPEAAGMSPYKLKAAWGDKITFWGGLGSQSTIPFATPDEIRREIRKLRSEMGNGGGYILAPAKPLRPETPTENAVAVVEELLTNKRS